MASNSPWPRMVLRVQSAFTSPRLHVIISTDPHTSETAVSSETLATSPKRSPSTTVPGLGSCMSIAALLDTPTLQSPSEVHAVTVAITGTTLELVAVAACSTAIRGVVPSDASCLPSMSSSSWATVNRTVEPGWSEHGVRLDPPGTVPMQTRTNAMPRSGSSKPLISTRASKSDERTAGNIRTTPGLGMPRPMRRRGVLAGGALRPTRLRARTTTHTRPVCWTSSA